MIKGLAILPSILFAIAPVRAAMPFDNGNQYVLSAVEGGYCLDDVNEEYLEESELRVYFDEDKTIKEISTDAFKNCSNLESLMISRYIEKIPQETLTNISNLKTIKYTGSELQFKSLDLSVNDYEVEYYACDEGFLCYWFDYVRPTPEANICDISEKSYHELLTLYGNLSDDERQTVNNYEDSGDKIINSLNYLKSVKSPKVEPINTPDVEKSTMIAFILIIASVGMTFICVFYLLKERKVIN